VALGQLETPKRGYLAQIFTIPPLIYPFQYNPTQVVDSKRNEWGKREPNPDATVAKVLSTFASGGFLAGAGATLSTATEILGRTFSGAELKKLDKEGDRTLTFKFTIDGREQRAGEPARRRNDAGDIIGDLAVLRSFVYPQLANDLDIISAIAGSSTTTWSNVWFNHPPSVVLVLGGSSVEGFITEMKVTETLFNTDLDPTKAEVDVTMIEKIDSISFALDSIKRLGRSFYYTAYEDIGKVLF
jgi:hypothetical protein